MMTIIKYILLISAAVFAGYLISGGYQKNIYWVFYSGFALLSLSFAGLAYFTSLKRFSLLGILVNILIVSMFGLGILELGYVVKSYFEKDNKLPEMSYSYAEAKDSPDAFKKWWDHYLATLRKVWPKYIQADTTGYYPFVAIPNATAKAFDATISINSLGFKNREFSIDKGNVYRIVAIGESTTAGALINATDLPWPVVLENILKQRLDIGRPIEVINAGFPGYNLSHNLHRLRDDILPLSPDMVISYHGHNGFKFILNSLPKVGTKDPPVYRYRPSWLLARIEYTIKIFRFRKNFYASVPESGENTAEPKHDLLKSKYARYYKQLIGICRTHHIEVVLCTFNMSVNEQSPEDVIAFYEQGHPVARKKIRANKAHNEMLRQFAEKYRVPLVDTSPNLDGAYDKQFIDLVHFTQSGRDQLAEHIFPVVKEIITKKFGIDKKHR